MKNNPIRIAILALFMSCNFRAVEGDAVGIPEPEAEPSCTAESQPDAIAADPLPANTTTIDASNLTATTADSLAEELHPVHRVLNELETRLNSLGSFAISKLQGYINDIRNLV